ncbi:MAG: hypothetical protein ACLP4W_22385 [Mycobacterium sp.]|uniref:hypothetical protein n=1 Tax=Mycobacterium sp. TaxID=1785 RepID=UPI003F9C6BD1
MSTPPGRTASAGGAAVGMPARLWEAAKHGARGTIPPWVRAAPDAGATAPPRIGEIARRAAQVAAAAGVVGGGTGVGVGAAAAASRPVDLAHSGGSDAGADHISTGPGGGAPGAEHISTEHISTGPGGGAPGAEHISTELGTGSPASSDSGGAPGPPGSASEGGVTLHTSGDGGHLATGLATSWRMPGHGAVGGEHGEDGTEGGHDGLTVEMYQDVVVREGADGMFSVDAVEYVVVRDEHGHAYVFHENYHTVVPDPPGQETDLVVHETDRVQVVEHPDGSFSVTQADNSISVTVGSGGDRHNEVTVTQTESVQTGDDPNTDGHDTASLTEIESGATTSDQTEAVSTSVPQPPGQEPVPPANAEAPGGPPTQAGEMSGQSDDGAVHGTAGSTTLSTASTAASSQVGTAPSTPREAFPAARVMSTPPLANSLGVAATTAGGLTSGHEPDSPGAFAGLRGGPAEPGRGAASAGHFPDGPVQAQHPAGGAFDSAPGSADSRPFEHPTTEPPADTPTPDPHQDAAFVGHDQPGLDEPGAHGGTDLAAVDPTEPGPSADAHSVGEYEGASEANPDSSAGSAHALSGHDPGTDTTVIH